MMSDGGPAFPIFSFNNAAHSVDASGGMSLRDYFAAAALQGMFAGTDEAERMRYIKDGITFARFAENAYNAADAMLIAREQS